MKLSAPKQAVWLIAVILGILGIIGSLTVVAILTEYSFWLVAIAFVLLALATLLEGL